jgi:hypothetical protein
MPRYLAIKEAVRDVPLWEAPGVADGAVSRRPGLSMRTLSVSIESLMPLCRNLSPSPGWSAGVARDDDAMFVGEHDGVYSVA